MPEPTRAMARLGRHHDARHEEALRNEYIAAVLREASRRLASTRSPFDVDDITALVVERLVRDIDGLMVQYPNPAVYAGVVARTTAIDFDRTQNAQRGVGARITRDDQGEVVVRRTVVSGDRRDGETGLGIFETLAAETDAFDELVEVLDATETVVGLLGTIPARQAEAIYLDKGLGVDQSVIGTRQRRRRETVNRDVSNGMRTLVRTAAAARGDEA
ncbi:MAG: hypothetical protein RI958_2506 [Actinomycetota bacterium]